MKVDLEHKHVGVRVRPIRGFVRDRIVPDVDSSYLWERYHVSRPLWVCLIGDIVLVE